MNKGRDERVHYLYLILLPDGRGYIGVSADPDRRFAPSAGTFISKAILHHGRHSCHFKILCEGPRKYMYYLERRAIKAFNTRYPAGYNLDAGGLIPEHHPMSVEKNVASNATRLQRERAEFRADYGISKAQFFNYKRLKPRGSGRGLMAADLPDLDNRTASESDPSRPWQLLSRRYIPEGQTRASLARGARRRK